MITLFLYWLTGVLIGWLVDAVKADKFVYSIPKIALQVALGLLFSFGLSKAGLTHWGFGLLLTIVGFLSFHVVQFLIKKKS